MKVIFNLDALVKVEIEDKKVCRRFEYQPYRKFWFWTQDEMFICPFIGSYTRDYLRDNTVEGIKFLVEGDNVYYRPNVTLTFAGKASVNKSFDTYEEAEAWGKEQADKNISAQLTLTH